MVIEGLSDCIAAELLTMRLTPSSEEIRRSRNFAIRYIGDHEWLVRAGFELPEMAIVMGTWRVNERTRQILSDDPPTAGRPIGEYCRQVLDEKSSKG